jgi:hypothetical protein
MNASNRSDAVPPVALALGRRGEAAECPSCRRRVLSAAGFEAGSAGTRTPATPGFRRAAPIARGAARRIVVSRGLAPVCQRGGGRAGRLAGSPGRRREEREGPPRAWRRRLGWASIGSASLRVGTSELVPHQRGRPARAADGTGGSRQPLVHRAPERPRCLVLHRQPRGEEPARHRACAGPRRWTRAHRKRPGRSPPRPPFDQTTDPLRPAEQRRRRSHEEARHGPSSFTGRRRRPPTKPGRPDAGGATTPESARPRPVRMRWRR